MKTLVWQFHLDAGRSRDGENSIQWASCSAELTLRYCMKYGLQYQYCSDPSYWKLYPGAGPGFERFQLFEEVFDGYDYILYLDTDILLSADAPNLFDIYKGVDIASFNWPNTLDLALFDGGGWLSTSGIPIEQYKDRYVAGGMYLMSRKFRVHLRDHVKASLLRREEDFLVPMTYPQFSARWPCGDQSILSYLMCKYSFSYAKLPREYTRGPYGYNFCGDKTKESLSEYFKLYHQYRAGYSSCPSA